VDIVQLQFPLWFLATGTATAGAWFCWTQLRRRDVLVESLDRLHQAVLSQTDFQSQTRALCQTCMDGCKAVGATLYFRVSKGESGFRRAAEVGRSAEETGPGLVRDLLQQAWDTGQPAESQYAGRWILAIPVGPGRQGMGVLLACWEGTLRPDAHQRRLLDSVTTLATLIGPRFQEEGALAKAQQALESMQVEMAQEHQMASVGRLAAGVAHELNTPLGAVLAMVSSLQRHETDENKGKRLRIVREAVEKCKGIIEKLLVYSREPVETEQGLTFSRFVRADADLNDVIKGTVDLLAETLSADQMKVTLDLQDLPPARINSTQWSHLFNNLLINARDALKSAGVPNPEVEIRTRNEGAQLKVEVSDNGPGIPEENRKKVFQPFFTTKDIGRGTGLGLAIASEVVRKHQGNISVGSGPKGGAQFTIILPVAK
jgi:signal transduction histidine kinase